LLRSVDHEARLIVGRSATLPVATQAAFSDLARRLDYQSDQALASELQDRMRETRLAYDRIMLVDQNGHAQR
jgi:hypothetical protein